MYLVPYQVYVVMFVKQNYVLKNIYCLVFISAIKEIHCKAHTNLQTSSNKKCLAQCLSF